MQYAGLCFFFFFLKTRADPLSAFCSQGPNKNSALYNFILHLQFHAFNNRSSNPLSCNTSYSGSKNNSIFSFYKSQILTLWTSLLLEVYIAIDFEKIQPIRYKIPLWCSQFLVWSHLIYFPSPLIFINKCWAIQWWKSTKTKQEKQEYSHILKSIQKKKLR